MIFNVSDGKNQSKFIAFILQVAPHDFSRFQGGQDLLDQVSSLSAKVALHKAELARGGAEPSTMSRTEETASTFSDSEERGLLRPKQQQQLAQKQQQQELSSPHRNEETTLKINIEPNMFSLKGAGAARVEPEG